MINLVEMLNDVDFTPAPCKHGNIVEEHACYCHSEDASAPRKCPIWRCGDEWKKENCDLFEPPQQP